jgi:hypothetical protein
MRERTTMLTTPTGETTLTQDEYLALVSKAGQADYAIKVAKEHADMLTKASREFQSKTYDYFKEIAEGAIDHEEVTEVYNGLAALHGWATVTSLVTSLYTVEVRYEGMTIGYFESIEAMNEDDAIEQVENGINYEVEISITAEFNGDCISDRVGVDTYSHDLEYEAHLED